MPKIRLVIEYNGAGFHGWQVQPGLRTIQGELQRVLELIFHQPLAPIMASGRTDAGVHARGQVVHVVVPTLPDFHVLRHSVSSLLRREVTVLAAEPVADDFHAQRDACAKQYTYTILNRAAPAVLDWGRVWHLSAPLDWAKMQAQAALLQGAHDFKSFQGRDCGSNSMVKEIFESEIIRSGDYLYYRVVGSGFLKQMVRIIVGTLVDIACARLPVDRITEILAARDRKIAGQTAPPQGLCLDWVRYDR